MFKGRIYTLVFMGLLLSIILVACGGEDKSKNANTGGVQSTETKVEVKQEEKNLLNPDDPQMITFYSYSLAYPTMKQGMEQLIQEFNDTIGKEKGIVVQGVADSNFQQFKADISAGKDVDVVQHVFGTLDSSRQTLGFRAYEDIFPQDEMAQHLVGIAPNALELGKIDGKMYGLAFTFSTPIVFINGKLFTEAGLDPTQPPQTWEAIKQASLQIKQATGKDGFGLAPNNGWITEALIRSNGGEVLAADRKSVKFGESQAVEAIAMWQDLYQNGAHAKGNESEIAEQFMAGNLGMYVSSTALHSGALKASEAGGWALYGAALPSFGEKPSIPVNSGSMLAVRPDTPEKTAAVWEFIKFVTGDRGYTIITSSIGYLPLRTGLADDPAYLKQFVDDNPLYRINLDQLTRIQPVAIWPGEYATEMSTLFADAIAKTVVSGEDATETLQQAQDTINAMLR